MSDPHLAPRLRPLARRARRALSRAGWRSGDGGAAQPAAALDYERLRRAGPVVHLPDRGFWVVLGHAEATLVMRDPVRFTSDPYEPIDIALLSASPPRHTQVRQAIRPWLSNATLEALAAGAGRHASALVRPQLDAVAGYARPISRGVAIELIGLGAEDGAAVAAAADAADGSAEPFKPALAAIDRVGHRSRLHESLARDAAGVLGPAELRSFLRLLWLASTATTERAISNSVHRLLVHDRARAEVERDPELLGAFIEEVLRLHPADPLILRRATEDVPLGGVTIPADAPVRLALPAINRDPERFEDPDTLRLDRAPGRQLTFGSGPHHCIGAALARRTVRAAVATLLRELPGFRSALAPVPPLDPLAPSRLPITR